MPRGAVRDQFHQPGLRLEKPDFKLIPFSAFFSRREQSRQREVILLVSSG